MPFIDILALLVGALLTACILRSAWGEQRQHECSSYVLAHAANADQIAFGPFLPGVEMMLVSSLHGIHENTCHY